MDFDILELLKNVEPVKTLVGAIVAGGVGGLLLNLEKIETLDSLKKTDPVKVVRNLIYGGLGGVVFFGTGLVNPFVVCLGGYFGEKTIRTSIAIARRLLPFKKG